MAIYKIFANKDATIYSNQPTINAGRDELLEISSINNTEYNSNVGGLDDIRRTLLQFSDQDLQILKDLSSGSAYNVNLRLYLAYASALPQNYTVECYPVSQSWDMGTGRYTDLPNSKNGVCWYTPFAYAQSPVWNDTTGTHSYLYTTGGGTWNSAYKTSQSFDYMSNKDINLDVTPIVDKWFSGSIPNYGLLLKHTASIELDLKSALELKYFSVDTHTIYPPCLELKWQDVNYNTGSTTVGTITADDFVLLVENNLAEFKEGTTYRFKVKGRDRFPSRDFTTSSEYLNWKYLPQQSYWALQDYKTKEMVVDFDETYTKISANNSSNYFYVYMNGLEPERSYKILIKTILDGTDEAVIIDQDNIFKVGR